MDKLLDQLQSDNLIREDQACIISTEAAMQKLPVHTVLLQTGFVTVNDLLPYQDGSASIVLNVDDFVPDSRALSLLPQSIARTCSVLPISLDTQSNQLVVAMSDPTNVLVRDSVRREVDSAIAIHYERADSKQISQLLDKCYGSSYSLQAVLRELNEQAVSNSQVGHVEQTPVIRLVDAMLQDAITRRASDIHLSPEQAYVQIRYRIDGVLHSACCLHIRHWPAILVRIKVMSDIDIAETRLAQDGHITRNIHGQSIDFRVASFPLHAGENLVLRVLDRQRGLLTLAALCPERQMQHKLAHMLKKPSGLLLVCGPTGSGKTTTLYALLRTLDSAELNIMTLEDPVEYPMANIQQTRVHSGAAFGFAEGVRGLLRQDPDVILVGEVRDPDSCAMTCRAAMTGHLVLTSTHAGDCLGAIARLTELHAERAAIASVLTGVVAQRLIRKLCTHCLQGDIECGVCGGTGYSGRVALFECLKVTDAFADLLSSGADRQTLEQQALRDGMKPLKQVAKQHLLQGLTTVEELQRVFGATCLED